jgi:hypothetical protein
MGQTKAATQVWRAGQLGLTASKKFVSASLALGLWTRVVRL